MDIEDRSNDVVYFEYILPRVVNILTEDDIILEFDISIKNVYVSMVYLFIDLREYMFALF